MARPLKKGLDYFPHDTDAVTDEKIEILRSLYGNDGYAFYFILLERIYRTDKGELDISTNVKKAGVNFRINVSLELFTKMLESSFEINLFDKATYEERGFLTSKGIKERFSEVDNLRIKWRKNKTENRVENSEENTEKRGESKEKHYSKENIKGNYIKEKPSGGETFGKGFKELE